MQTAASAAAPVRTIGYTLVPLPQTDEKEAVAPADDPAAEEAPEEAPAPEEAVPLEDDAAGDPNAVPDDLELLDTFLATAYYFTLIMNVLGLILGGLMLVDPLVSWLSARYLVSFYLILLGVDCVILAFSKLGSRE